jgi:hypothetical protein
VVAQAMTAERSVVLDGVPSRVTGYARSVVLPRRGLRRGDTVPEIGVTRRGFTIDAGHLAAFRKLCGGEPSAHLPFVYPLSWLFHYHLGIFAHRDFPWSLRKLLGLRNHVVQRRRIPVGDTLDLDARTAGQRVLPKGVEFDVHTVLSSGGASVWESIHVYYLRADAGGEDTRPAPGRLRPLDAIRFETSWKAPGGGGWQFGRLSGDLNPVHYFAPWARLLGFRGAFCHTQRIVSDCLRRLPGGREVTEAESLRLDVAFKGPIYYGSELVMRGAARDDGYRFDLYCGAVDRPAMPGSIQRVTADHDLLAGSG